MISLTTVVWVILGCLVGVMVLGLLWWLINYCESAIGGPPQAYAVIRVIFVILVVLLLIGLLLSFITGTPLVRLG